MLLKFLAKSGHCVHWPGPKAPGQVHMYVGRDFVPGDKEKGTAVSHPASKEPATVESDSFEGTRLAKLCSRDDSLWPADESTAAFCSKVYVELALVDGEWSPKATAPVAAKKVSNS